VIGRDTERGAGSVLAIGIMASTALLSIACIPLVLVLVVKSQASAAADAAALAAADVRVGIVAGFPCEVARKIAVANRVQLVSCTLDGLDATVRVTFRVAGLDVEAIATAGQPR
jgi:secretion/DNA translocation related TadE-like protein